MPPVAAVVAGKCTTAMPRSGAMLTSCAFGRSMVASGGGMVVAALTSARRASASSVRRFGASAAHCGSTLLYSVGIESIHRQRVRPPSRTSLR
eukprot:3230125-Prymnesium_polylepis.1